MTTPITLEMPAGPAGRHTIDLDTLSPKARALAEAIAATGKRWIHIRSIAPLRDLYHTPADAEFIHGVSHHALDEPAVRIFESWQKNRTGRCDSVATILEYEARKMDGWYPVADRHGTDLPSSAAARAAEMARTA